MNLKIEINSRMTTERVFEINYMSYSEAERYRSERQLQKEKMNCDQNSTEI